MNSIFPKNRYNGDLLRLLKKQIQFNDGIYEDLNAYFLRDEKIMTLNCFLMRGGLLKCKNLPKLKKPVKMNLQAFRK